MDQNDSMSSIDIIERWLEEKNNLCHDSIMVSREDLLEVINRKVHKEISEMIQRIKSKQTQYDDRGMDPPPRRTHIYEGSFYDVKASDERRVRKPENAHKGRGEAV